MDPIRSDPMAVEHLDRHARHHAPAQPPVRQCPIVAAGGVRRARSHALASGRPPRAALLAMPILPARSRLSSCSALARRLVAPSRSGGGRALCVCDQLSLAHGAQRAAASRPHARRPPLEALCELDVEELRRPTEEHLTHLRLEP
eukprot:5370874-Prymnesium_polylepis.2